MTRGKTEAKIRDAFKTLKKYNIHCISGCHKGLFDLNNAQEAIDFINNEKEFLSRFK